MWIVWVRSGLFKKFMDAGLVDTLAAKVEAKKAAAKKSASELRVAASERGSELAKLAEEKAAEAK